MRISKLRNPPLRDIPTLNRTQRPIRVVRACLPQTREIWAVVKILRDMVKGLVLKEELIVVDRYLLPRADAFAPVTLKELIRTVAAQLQRLVIVTSEKYDRRSFEFLRTWLRKETPTSTLVLRTSENFHDRFWIADRQRGLSVGTSPNGLGLRYSHADYMSTTDVKEIVAALNREGLL